MKKIVTLGAIAVLAAGFIFADEPAADVSVTEFKGEAKVTWGMDLDAMKTGFKNTESANFKVKLFSSGDKTTEGEGIWGELKVKTDGLKLENGEWKDGKASVDAATLHINDFFVGIRSGDTVLGSYKFDGAVRSADNANAQWVDDFGPNWNDDWKYKYGIQAGYDSSDIKIAFDIRSLADKDGKYTQYTNSYSVALEGELKDSNQWLEGLFVKGGFGYNLSGEYWWDKTVEGAEEDDLDAKQKKQYEFDPTGTGDANGGFAKTKKKKGTPATTDKPGVRTWLQAGDKPAGANYVQNGHVFGYEAQAGYKYKLDDTYFVKPAVAFAGETGTIDVNYGDNKWGKASYNKNELSFGAIFGWGSTADANAGIYYLDGDQAKKVTPGVSVVVEIPLASTTKAVMDKTYKTKTHNAALAVITPSFYTNGELVEGLTAALYSEIALLNYKDNPDTTGEVHDASYTKTNSDGTDSETWNNCYWKDEKFAFALTGGLKYAIKSGDITATPQAAFRFANVAYVENGIKNWSPLKSHPVFDKMGSQDVIRDVNNSKKKYGNGGYVAGFLNIKAGVEVGGLIPNTTFDFVYESANLMNKIDYTSKEISVNGTNVPNPYYLGADKSNYEGAKWYNVKLGHFDIGCKIAF